MVTRSWVARTMDRELVILRLFTRILLGGEDYFTSENAYLPYSYFIHYIFNEPQLFVSCLLLYYLFLFTTLVGRIINSCVFPDAFWKKSNFLDSGLLGVTSAEPESPKIPSPRGAMKHGTTDEPTMTSLVFTVLYVCITKI